MDSLYYDMIFKRKSFHRFTGAKRLCEQELLEIQSKATALKPLLPGIRTTFCIVPREQTTCKRGEYCILIYSEPHVYSLQNVGYMAEQLDLWLASRNIGACWYGMGKTDADRMDGLDFVIMMAIEKAEPTEFRKDYTKAKRKGLNEIWLGDRFTEIASVVRFAPSACNTQPWLVEEDGGNLAVFRILGKSGMMPKDRVPTYNKIDLGIFLLFLELCLEKERYLFTRKLYPDCLDDREKNLTAFYELLDQPE